MLSLALLLGMLSAVSPDPAYSESYWIKINGNRTPVLKVYEKYARKLDRNRDSELVLEELSRSAEGFPEVLACDLDDHAVSLSHEMTGTPSVHASYYPDLTEAYRRIEHLRATFPDQIQVHRVAESVDGNPVQWLQLRSEETPIDAPRILIVANQHGREWTTLLVALDLVPRVLSSSLLERIEVWIVPLANPDGYAYSHRSSPLWRKNRTPFDDSVGVDLNRNFSRSFRPSGDRPNRMRDDVGASDDPDSQQYRGTEALSELETRGLQTLLQSSGLIALIDLHSFGSKVLLPKPDEAVVPIEQYERLGSFLVESLGDPYALITTEDLYPISGHLAGQADALGVVGITLEIGRAFQPHPSKVSRLVETTSQGLLQALELWLAERLSSDSFQQT